MIPGNHVGFAVFFLGLGSESGRPIAVGAVGGSQGYSKYEILSAHRLVEKADLYLL